MAPIYNGGESRYKLSKPPKTRAVALSPSPAESRSDLETSFPNDSSPNTVTSLETITSRHSRVSFRESLYGDGTPLRKEVDSDEEDDLEISSKSMRKRFSRTNTAVSKRASMRLSLGLSRTLTTEPRDDSVVRESEEEDINNTIKRKADKDKFAALNQSLETTIDECGVHERIISPIRRRSFFTPGLATRDAADMLAKPPIPTKKQQGEFEYYYNPRLSVTSPLERLAALDLANRPVTPLARASTPGDLDYGLIGRLRITNGAASPAPSARSYNTPAGRTSIAWRNSASYFNLPVSSSPLIEPASPVTQEARQSKDYTYASEIPLGQHGADYTQEDVLIYSDIFGPPRLRFEFKDDYDFEVRQKRSKSYSALPPHDRTSLIARDYKSDLAENPFEITSPYSIASTFQATSKPSEMEAELFDELSLKHKHSNESVKQLNFVLPDVVSFGDNFEEQTSNMLARVGNSSSTLASSGLEIASRKDPAVLYLNDSGYNSSSSTNSYQRDLGCHAGPDIVEIPKYQGRTYDHQQDSQETIKMRHRPVPVTIPTSTTTYDSVFSGSMQNSTETITTISTAISTYNIKSQPLTPRKLQKIRPQSQPPPSNRVSIQMHPEIVAEDIPFIPAELAARMARRVADIPPLTHTLPSIDHLRLEKKDYEQAPLSAPMRFPSPQPTIDQIWNEVIGTKGQRPRITRVKQSFLNPLQGKKSQQKLTQSTHHNANMLGLGDVNSFFRDPGQRIDSLQHDLTPCQGGLAPSSNAQLDIPRAKSVIGLTGAEAAELSRLQSTAGLTNTRANKRSVRSSSSVYTGPSPTVASSVWTDATPELRQTSSVYIPAFRPSPPPDNDTSSSVDTDVTQLPTFPIDEVFTMVDTYIAPRKTRRQSFNKTWDDPGAVIGKLPRVDSGSKDLPPLPSIPVAMYVKMHEEKAKNTVSKKKTLPPLPHQRKTSDHVIPRGLSPCRESGYWITTTQKRIQSELPAVASLPDLVSGVNLTPENSMDRITRMHSEPPSLSPFEWQSTVSPSERSPSPGRQPTLPQLTRFSSPQLQDQQSHKLRETRSQSPEHKQRGRIFASASRQSQSPERTYFKWAPPKPDGVQRRYTDWPQTGRSASPQQRIDQDHSLRDTPVVPQGLVARMSGHFELGSQYNYDAGPGMASTTGIRDPVTVVKKSTYIRQHYDFDLADTSVSITS